MFDHQYEEFAAFLNEVSKLFSRSSQQPLTSTVRMMYFRALTDHPIEVVRSAFDAHVKDPQRGRFFPLPADIVAQIQGLLERDGRPGASEAWGIAVRNFDGKPFDVQVATDEIDKAWDIAESTFNGGDKIGARMAFIEAYERIVEGARRSRQPAIWRAFVEGQDGKSQALIKADMAGLLPSPGLPMHVGPKTHAELMADPELPDSLRQRIACNRQKQIG